MIKKIYFSIVFSLLHCYFCNAQPPNGQNRLETIKIAYITKELDLSTEEAMHFWPAYNNYMDEIKQASNQYQDNTVEYEEKVVQIKKKYKNNFQKILGSETRVNKMYVADRNYRDMLRRELQNRQKEKKSGGSEPGNNRNKKFRK